MGDIDAILENLYPGAIKATTIFHNGGLGLA